MAEQRSLIVISLEVIFDVVTIMVKAAVATWLQKCCLLPHVTQVGSIPAFIAAAMALGTFKNSADFFVSLILEEALFFYDC